MRVLYFNDQTKAFYKKPKEIYMLGNLYLKGKPYTKYDEAVDKEYVDESFKNISAKNIHKRIPDSAFPAFEGDLLNKAGENNFKLPVVISPGLYHNPHYDGKGRIIKGTPGHIILTDKEINRIDFIKIEFKGSEWGKIEGWTNGFNRNDYLMLDEGGYHFSKPIAIRNERIMHYKMVINEDQVYEVSEEFFRGKIGKGYFKPITDLSVEFGSVYDYNNFNQQPYKYQSNITPYSSDPVSAFVAGHSISDLIGFSKEYYISHGYLYLLASKQTGGPETPPSTRYFRWKIKSDGLLGEREELSNPLPEKYKTVSYSSLYFSFIGERLTICLLEHHKYTLEWKTIFGELDPKDGQLKSLNIISDNVIQNQYSRRVYGCDLHLQTFPAQPFVHYPNYLTGEVERSKGLNGEVNFSGIDGRDSSYVWFNLGPIMYLFHAWSVFDGAVRNTTKMKRIYVSDSAPFGEWLEYPLKGSIPNGDQSVVMIRGLIIIITRAANDPDYNAGDLVLTYIPYDSKGEFGNITKRVIASNLPDYMTGAFIGKDSIFITFNDHIRVYKFKGSTNSPIPVNNTDFLYNP